MADAATLARLYRQRWSIKRAFLHLTTELQCEVHTLSYQPAALFALALSSHAMAADLRNMEQNLEVIVDAQDWQIFRLARLTVMAAWLLDQARSVSFRRYAKALARKKPLKAGGQARA